MGGGLGVKKERGDCSPLSSVTKANSLPSVLPFYRNKPTATKFHRAIPSFALRRPPSFGLTTLRNATTGSNPVEPCHDCRLLPRLAEAFHPPLSPRSSSSFRLPCHARSVRLECLDNAFVTLPRCGVNQTHRDFSCGNFGNVEIAPESIRSLPDLSVKRLSVVGAVRGRNLATVEANAEIPESASSRSLAQMPGRYWSRWGVLSWHVVPRAWFVRLINALGPRTPRLCRGRSRGHWQGLRRG